MLLTKIVIVSHDCNTDFIHVTFHFVSSGRPKPSVTWWMNGTLIDDFTEQVFQDQSNNRLLIPVVTRDLRQAVVECRASSTPSIPAQIKTIALDVYRKYLNFKESKQIPTVDNISLLVLN